MFGDLHVKTRQPRTAFASVLCHVHADRERTDSWGLGPVLTATPLVADGWKMSKKKWIAPVTKQVQADPPGELMAILIAFVGLLSASVSNHRFVCRHQHYSPVVSDVAYASTVHADMRDCIVT